MHPGREHEDELTIFESLGIAVEDLASAELIVRRAREHGVGVEVDVLIPLADIEAARERIAGTVIRTPLVRLRVDAPAEIWLKLENLQPIGSFKLRGAANASSARRRRRSRDGLVTTSTGNMAQGVAWMARELGVPATIVVPDNASMTKLAAVERLGGRIVRVPWEQWWAAVDADGERDLGDGVEGFFVHPVAGSAGDGRQRHHRARAGRGPRRVRRRAHPVGRRRADDRHRERAPARCARRRRSSSASPRRERP